MRVILASWASAKASLQRYTDEASASPGRAKWRGSKASVLEGLKLQHPVPGSRVPVILGDHVTLEAGTGAVHTAPAHGQDDYIVGRRYNLPGGESRAGRWPLPGRHAAGGWHEAGGASAKIIETLKGSAALLQHAPLRHSYPHCWRHKTPVIFRATPQWFISMDQKGLRANTLRDIPKVKWIPRWGQQRIAGMIETRPDWCISRQRTWGVPITLFAHNETSQLHPRTQELIEEVAKSGSRPAASTRGSTSTRAS